MTRDAFIAESLLMILGELHKRCHRRMIDIIAELRAEGTLDYRLHDTEIILFEPGHRMRILTEEANDRADHILVKYERGRE